LDDQFKNTLTPHGKKMHVKEIYVIFIHLFNSGILLIIDLDKNKGKKGGCPLPLLRDIKLYH
jgi:hypothetical protein